MGKITFDLHNSRKGFIWIGFQFIWAGIRGDKVVYIRDIECDQITNKGVPIVGSNKNEIVTEGCNV